MISKGGLNGQKNKEKLSGAPKRRKGERNAPADRQRHDHLSATSRDRASIRSTRSTWELRTAAITGEGGQVYFEQKDVEVPASLVADGDQRRRAEVLPRRRRHAVARALGQASSSAAWSTPSPAGAPSSTTSPPTPTRPRSAAELTHLLVEQKMSFNSPVWFNVGVEAHPQCSACFINSVDDSMESILGLAKTEGMLFKYGSGTGTNLSPIRSSQRAAQRRRHGLGPGLVHEGLRRLRRRHQVGRQDPSRGQDGHPQRRAPRHRSTSSTAR